jgi:hypothetical protein
LKAEEPINQKIGFADRKAGVFDVDVQIDQIFHGKAKQAGVELR